MKRLETQTKYTVRDLAKDAGVSIATVSRFLNQDYSSMSESTRNKLRELVEKSGYTNTKAKTPLNVAIVLPNLSDPFFAQIVEEVEKCLDPYPYNLQLSLSGESFERERKYVKKLIQQNISGIVYMSTVNEENNCYDMLKESGIPFVVMDSYLSEYNVPALVFSNGVYGMYESAKYLIEMGHKKIAYISGIRFNMFEHYRYQGYVNALLDSELSVVPELVRFTGFSLEEGALSFESLLDSGEQFTAVMCENDVIALGVYQVCEKRGLSIPGDISVIGYNNTYIAQCVKPMLTSIDQHVPEMAQIAVDMLAKQIQGENLADKIVKVPPSLIKRESVKNITK